MTLATGQTAVVTGAGSGIGRAVAVALARIGLRVLLVGRDAAKLRAAVEDCGGSATAVVADITDAGGREAVAQAIGDELHALVHAAGAWVFTPPPDLSAEDWRALDAVNLHAPILLTTRCLDPLRAARGCVAIVNSTAALQAGPNVLAYAAGKAALRAATDALRQAVNPQGVRVLSVFPGRTDTPMQATVLAAEQRGADPAALMQPDDVAAMVLAALMLPERAEVTEIIMRPSRKL